MEWHSKFSGPNTSPGFLLWQSTQSWRRKVGKALAEFDLTHVQFVLLTSCKYMIAHGETVTQKTCKLQPDQYHDGFGGCADA